LLTQAPNETYSIIGQTMMLDIVLNLQDDQVLDMKALKSQVADYAAQLKKDEDYEHLRDELLHHSLVEMKR
jgi:hypothetical protein